MTSHLCASGAVLDMPLSVVLCGLLYVQSMYMYIVYTLHCAPIIITPYLHQFLRVYISVSV